MKEKPKELTAEQILGKEKTLITADILTRKYKRKVGEFFLTKNNIIIFIGKTKWLGLKIETYRAKNVIIPLSEITHASYGTSIKNWFSYGGNTVQLSLTKEGVERISSGWENYSKEGNMVVSGLIAIFGVKEKLENERKIIYRIGNIKAITGEEKFTVKELAEKITEFAEKAKV